MKATAKANSRYHHRETAVSKLYKERIETIYWFSVFKFNDVRFLYIRGGNKLKVLANRMDTLSGLFFVSSRHVAGSKTHLNEGPKVHPSSDFMSYTPLEITLRLD